MIPTQLTRALGEYTQRVGGESPFRTAISGVTILSADRPRRPTPLIYRPALCLVAQGAKRGAFGDATFEFRSGQALVVGIETPSFGWVSEATPDRPFLGIVIEFELAAMREMLAQTGAPVAASFGGGVFVADAGPEVFESVLRLVQLLDRPAAIATIAPLVMRELYYWLLSAPYGAQIAAMIVDGAHSHGIVAAIHELRTRFAEPIRIDQLASAANMSASTFHRQFKIVTSMTPLQYQKQLRLLEARHLMVDDAANAETAAFRVGYESQSHFSREYSRMFGAPPRRDVATFRARVQQTAV